VLKGNSVISKNKDTSLWNFVVNSGLRKFRHGISIVKTCYQLSSRKVDAPSVINWAVVGQLTPTLDHYSLSHRSSSAVYSTILPHRTVLPKANTWFSTCHTNSFYTVAWQLARFQLTRRIERSLGDSCASCLPCGYVTGLYFVFCCLRCWQSLQSGSAVVVFVLPMSVSSFYSQLYSVRQKFLHPGNCMKSFTQPLKVFK